MIENIHWLGHDSFRLDGSSTVYIDPWKLSGDAPPADLILVTHDHYDHFSPDDIARLATPRTTLIGPASVTAQVGGVAAVTLSAGETVDGRRRHGDAPSPPTISTSSASPARCSIRGPPAAWATSWSSTAAASTTPATPTRSPRCATCAATWRCCR